MGTVSDQHTTPQWGQHMAPMSDQHMASTSRQHMSSMSDEHMSSMNDQHMSSMSGQHMSTKRDQHMKRSGQNMTSTSDQHMTPASRQHMASTSGQHIPPSSGQHTASYSGQYIPPSSGQHTASYSGQHIVPSSGQHTVSYSGQHPSSYSGQHIGASNGQHMASNSGQHTASYSGQHTASNSGQHTASNSGQHTASNSGQHMALTKYQQSTKYQTDVGNNWFSANSSVSHQFASTSRAYNTSQSTTTSAQVNKVQLGDVGSAIEQAYLCGVDEVKKRAAQVQRARTSQTPGSFNGGARTHVNNVTSIMAPWTKGVSQFASLSREANYRDNMPATLESSSSEDSSENDLNYRVPKSDTSDDVQDTKTDVQDLLSGNIYPLVSSAVTLQQLMPTVPMSALGTIQNQQSLENKDVKNMVISTGAGTNRNMIAPDFLGFDCYGYRDQGASPASEASVRGSYLQCDGSANSGFGRPNGCENRTVADQVRVPTKPPSTKSSGKHLYTNCNLNN